MTEAPKKPDQKKEKPDLPESTLRIMERMVKTPPKPRQQPEKGKPASRPGRRNAVG